ncbi:MAG: prepilin-type N-terminal cleavage/methylation domain-containing protein [Sedimentisphaerales bacterium]|nr:prepilin-type N-terminal cleavage/methylation domain-containing protein [Sedimentisphaerales bacterium]
MQSRKYKNKGITLIELMVTVVIIVVAIVSISGVIAGVHKDYSKMYKRVHGNVTNESYTARLKFDQVCRRGTAGKALIDTSIPSLEIWYYSVPNVNDEAYLPPDKFARFYRSDTNLMLSTGDIGSSADTTQIVASNVIGLEFSYLNPKSVQMVMTLKDQNHSKTITCGSVMHNPIPIVDEPAEP